MEALKKLINSTAWHWEYGLPLVPRHNNPWLYAAYSFKLLKINGIRAIDEIEMQKRFRKHFEECQLTRGLINRWPGGSGGMISHDELLGAAFVSRYLAREIYFYLKKSKYFYINKPEEINNGISKYKYNIYRFPWLIAFIKSRAFISPSFFEKIYFSFRISCIVTFRLRC